MKMPIEQLLDDFDAKEPFEPDRFVCLEEELNREATLPSEQQQLLRDISLMAALEQMAISGLLSMDDARIARIGEGSFARVYAVMMHARTIALKTLMTQHALGQRAHVVNAHPSNADADAQRSDVSIMMADLAPADLLALGIDVDQFRAGALQGLAQEADILASPGMETYLRGRSLTSGMPPFLLMQHIDGCNLFQLITRMPPDADEENRLAATCVTSAVRAQSVSGRIHLDIKPANIVVGIDGSVTHIDWALSRPIPDATVQRPAEPNAIGTPGYMAPEQMRGIVDEKSPVFAMGCVLFELFSRKNLMVEVMKDAGIQAGFLEMFTLANSSEYPAHLDRILQREFRDDAHGVWRMNLLLMMLEQNPLDRCSMQGAAHLLSAFADGPHDCIGEYVRIALRPPNIGTGPHIEDEGFVSAPTSVIE